MKKTVKRFRKNLINRVSVLLTVFSIFVCSGLYNPASLASDVPSMTLDLSSFIIGTPSGEYIRKSSTYTYSSYVSPSSESYLQYSPYSSSSTTYILSDFDYFITVPCYFYFDWGNSDISSFLGSNGSIYTLNGTYSFDVTCSISDGSSSLCTPIGLDFLSNNGNTTSTFLWNWATFSRLNINFSDFEFTTYGSGFMCSLNLYFAGNYSVSLQGAAIKPTSIKFNLNFLNNSSLNSRKLYLYARPSTGSNYDIVQGYDSSSGSSAQQSLDTSLSGADAESQSLFTSAKSNLQGFSLTDISAFSAVASGLSFVSSTMTSVYEALGGVNGAGVVLSVACSVLFVSFCIGAYKFYNGRKGG